MSRGVMLISKEVPMSGDSASIAIVTTAEMAPKSRLIIYAVRSDNKEILVDAMDFKVTGLFKNDVSGFIGKNWKMLKVSEIFRPI